MINPVKTTESTLYMSVSIMMMKRSTELCTPLEYITLSAREKEDVRYREERLVHPIHITL